MNALESRPPRPKLASTAVRAFYFIGVAAIVGWSLPKAAPAAPAGPPAESAMSMPDRNVPGTAIERPAPVPVTRQVRSRVNCEGCGVIESVRRIDTRDEIMEWCAIGDSAGTRVPGNLFGGGDRDDLPSLADMAAGVHAGNFSKKKFRVTTRHQIVVRFRDGTRHVFNEDSPRTLREGDRIQVIAGSAGANG